jgi:hypothetical protein
MLSYLVTDEGECVNLQIKHQKFANIKKKKTVPEISTYKVMYFLPYIIFTCIVDHVYRNMSCKQLDKHVHEHCTLQL